MQRKHWYAYSDQDNAEEALESYIWKAFEELPDCTRELVILCIGTDRVTGDSLGPITGHFLSAAGCRNVWGTLKNPVHAKNLQATLKEIRAIYPRPYVIAIDASLGEAGNVGKISVKNGPIRPGAAANKNLPWIGDVSITGIVNSLSEENFHSLQFTRLYMVMAMSQLIAGALNESVKRYYKKSVQKKVTAL